MLRTLVVALLAVVLGSAAAAQDRAPEYEALFHRQSGWTGADGTYSIPMSAGSTLWGFSDTFFGEVSAGAHIAPFAFVHNSLVSQSEDGLKFWRAPVFEPPDGVGWFWLLDGVARSADEAEILLGQFRATGDQGAFGFAQCGLWWARFRLPKSGDRVKVLDYKRLPFFWQDSDTNVTFGSSLMTVGPWCYIYGVHQRGLVRSSVLARAPRATMAQPSTWRFFDGKGWNRDRRSVSPLFDDASVEYSVHAGKDRFVYVGCAQNGMSGRIVARSAPSPAGPWSEELPVAEAPEHKGDVFCYNAKAHPELTRNGKVLVSYNVNTTDLEKAVSQADIYRPRFIWWTPPSANWLPVTPSRRE